MGDINTSKKIKSEGVNLFISYFFIIVVTIAIIIFLGCQFGCKKKEKMYSLPVNSIFYTFSGAQGDVVEGFSTSFLEASDTDENARQYMVDNADWGVTTNDTFGISMDLHGQKITGTQDAFNRRRPGRGNGNIINISVNFTELNFANTEWQWLDGSTGNSTFKYSNFSNVKKLDLSNANFAPDDASLPLTDNSETAIYTFAESNFANLTTLNFSGTIFAATRLGNIDPSSGAVVIAGLVFERVAFTNLRTLNLSNAIFAVNDMNLLENGSVRTALFAFASATFAALHTLNFGNCQLGDSNSGDNTIDNSCFANLNTQHGWNSDNKLQISGSWDWASNAPDQLNAWFGTDCWIFN